MMAVSASFTEFDTYKLTDVRLTDQELGYGSYATVLQLEYMGLKCAGKKIHEVLLRQGDTSYIVHRFEEECRLLSQIHHPNIVQFLGVYFQQGVQVPILVMEFLPTNLTHCIDQYKILPKNISYSILHDVALGLCYLHGQIPTIIHRDLSSNNVLLTPNMTAKISDLGVARILNLTPLQVSHLTQTPGTPAFMPPEVTVANPKYYDTSVDEFSYGILMIHIFSGMWPQPQVGPNRTELDGTLIPVSEAERRELFLQAVGDDHPLMNLILKCISNHPQKRPHASEIVKRLSEMVFQCPTSFTNRLEMLQRMKADGEEKRALFEEGERKDMVIQQMENKISFHREDIHAKEEQMSADIDRLSIVHSSEVEQLKSHIRDLNTQNQLIKTEKEAEIAELKSNATAFEAQIDKKAKILHQEREQAEIRLAEERKQYEMDLRREKEGLEMQLTKEREQYKMKLANKMEQISKEKEINRKMMADNQNIQSELLKLRSEITTLEGKNSKLLSETAEKDTTIQMKNASLKRKNSEIEAKVRALQEKDASILAMSEQLSATREYLATKPHSLQGSIVWKECAELPTKLSFGNATIFNGKVYCGGGDTDRLFNDHIVNCYDPSRDTWTNLPQLPVRHFGLGQVNGKLVAVGGKKSDDTISNKIYTYDERSQRWKETARVPPMSIARSSPGVLNLQSVLIVAGGCTSLSLSTPSVEIFKPDISKWYRTDPLPVNCYNISLVAIGNSCYALGGWRDSYLNQAFHFSIDDLLRNAVPTNQTTRSGSRDTRSAWKALPNIPTYRPTAAVLGGNLLAIGGRETSEGGNIKKEVYMYSPSTNSWIYIGDLPVPRSGSVVANLSYSQLMVIGGKDDGVRMNSVYTGSLTIVA